MISDHATLRCSLKSLVFQALTTEPTPVNLTNHSHFNLGGHGGGLDSIHGHFVTLNADR